MPNDILRYTQINYDDISPSGSSSVVDECVLGEASREGQKDSRKGRGNISPERAEGPGSERDCEAGRLIAYIKTNRPPPCKKSMARKAYEILARISEI